MLMFYELGWEVLKVVRVVVTELREVKYLLREFLDIETSNWWFSEHLSLYTQQDGGVRR